MYAWTDRSALSNRSYHSQELFSKKGLMPLDRHSSSSAASVRPGLETHRRGPCTGVSGIVAFDNVDD